MKAVLRSAALSALVLAVSAQAQAPAKPAAKPTAAAPAKPAGALTEKQKVSIMIGMDMVKSLEPIKDELDVAMLTRTIQAGFAGKPTGLTDAQAEQVKAAFMQRLQSKMSARQAQEAQTNQVEGQKFLAANKAKPGVRTTPSGLQYQILRPGAGAKPKSTDMVRVHYKGTLLNGEKFDSSYDRGQPAEFALNQVIQGWQEGLALMPVGSKFKFWIPGNIGYGPAGSPPRIGPNATLVFEVELLDIAK
ncbi:FKBP-type peptidyl-prolyl cis-trans isomerase [Arenimonas sp.]|uniref:FKBP-type peptidyl-prolyl cis-trans isomerase n=1 Tax=Arenimonas sp. TaxID=1872635 RepID=UPI0039E6E3E6